MGLLNNKSSLNCLARHLGLLYWRRVGLYPLPVEKLERAQFQFSAELRHRNPVVSPRLAVSQ